MRKGAAVCCGVNNSICSPANFLWQKPIFTGFYLLVCCCIDCSGLNTNSKVLKSKPPAASTTGMAALFLVVRGIVKVSSPLPFLPGICWPPFSSQMSLRHISLPLELQGPSWIVGLFLLGSTSSAAGLTPSKSQKPHILRGAASCGRARHSEGLVLHKKENTEAEDVSFCCLVATVQMKEWYTFPVFFLCSPQLLCSLPIKFDVSRGFAVAGTHVRADISDPPEIGRNQIYYWR